MYVLPKSAWSYLSSTSWIHLAWLNDRPNLTMLTGLPLAKAQSLHPWVCNMAVDRGTCLPDGRHMHSDHKLRPTESKHIDT